ncbi:MAG: SMP-30/gluconolactonase/LRE family protein, partial [Chloroflexota bacterium]
MEIKTAFQAQDILGEGPVWSREEEALYWVDIERPLLQRWHPQSNIRESWPMPSRLGCFALRRQGGALVGLQDGLYHFDFVTGDLINVHRLETNTRLRINDGKCDRNGRFWFGTMAMNERDPIAALYRWDGNGRCHTMRSGVAISNGL